MKKLSVGLICLIAMLGVVAMSGCNKHTHTYSDEWTSDGTYHWHAATCEHTGEQGEKAEHTFGSDGKCTVCGKEHLHENLTLVPEVPATCTEAGVAAHYKCSCGKLFDKASGGKEVDLSELTIDPKGHDEVLIHHPAVEATCTGGYEEYFECGSCHALFRDEAGGTEIELGDVAIAPDKTKHSSVKFVKGTPSTCIEHGTIDHYECESCGAKMDVDGTELDDVSGEKDPYNHAGEIEFVEGKAASCTEGGLREHFRCTACKMISFDPKGQDPIEDENGLRTLPIGHDFYNQVSVSDGPDGHHKVCRRCFAPETDENGEQVIAPHRPTEFGVCLDCGYDNGHEHLLEYHASVPATCASATADDPERGFGNKEYYYCGLCEKYFADEYGLKEVLFESLKVHRLLYHSFVMTHDESEHWLECTVCHEVDESSRSEHEISGGVCVGGSGDFVEGCGYENLVESDGLFFTETADGCFLRRVPFGRADIVIPSTVNDGGEKKDVTGIWSGVFDKYSALGVPTLRSVTIPTSIVRIDDRAFGDSEIVCIWYEGTKAQWENIVLQGENGGIKPHLNLYFYSETPPEPNDHNLYYHMVGGERVVYDHEPDPDNMPSFGVQYELRSDENGESMDEYVVSGVDGNYFANMPPVVRIQDKFNFGYPVTCIERINLFAYHSIIIPVSVKKFRADYAFAQGFVTNYFYEGDKEAWNKIENNSTAPFGLVAFYKEDEPQLPASEGRFWHYSADREPILWVPVSETGGAKLTEISDGNAYSVDGVESEMYKRIAIPASYNGLAVTTIAPSAFARSEAGELEYVIIPASITEFEDLYGTYRQFRDQPAAIYYEGSAADWEAISGHDEVLDMAMGRYSKHVYLFSAEKPNDVGLFWHYEDKTPVAWTETKSGDPIPLETVIKDGVKYVINDDLDKYLAVDFFGFGADLAVVADEIRGFPVVEILDNAFAVDKFSGSRLVLPNSIERIGVGLLRNPNLLETVITCFYKGTLEEFKGIEGSDSCGLAVDKIYIYAGSDEPREGRFWRYDEDGLPEIYVRERNEIREQGDYVYELFSDTAMIVHYGGDDAILDLPTCIEFDGKTYEVNAIDELAFADAKGPVGLIIPDTIVKIGAKAFYGLNSLKWVVIGSGTTQIGEQAFYYFDPLSIYDHVKTAFATEWVYNTALGTNESVPFARIFYDGDETDWANFTRGFVDWNGIDGKNGLRQRAYDLGHLNVYFKTDELPPFGADRYWYFDLNGMPKVHKANVVELEGIVYEYDPILGNAHVRNGSRASFAVADKLTIKGKTYDVTAIADNAFDRSIHAGTMLSRIVVPSSVTEIGAHAFRGQSSFTLVIGDNVKFGEGVLDGVNFVSVFYKGDRKQYEADLDLRSIVETRDYMVFYFSENFPSGNVSSYWHFADEFEELPTVYVDEAVWTDPASGIVYRYSLSSGTASVTGYVGGSKVLAVPESVYIGRKEYAVTEIVERAFASTVTDKRFEGVILPASIKYVGYMAFYGQRIEYYVMSGGIERIDGDAFAFSSVCGLFFNGAESEVEAFKAKLASMINAAPLLNIPIYSYLESAPSPMSDGKYWHFTDTRHRTASPWNEGVYVDENEVKYYYDARSGTATVFSSAFTSDKTLKIPSSVIVDGRTYTVSEIADSAFEFDAEVGFYLYGVEIPETVTRIGKRAFFGQSHIEYIVIFDVEIGDDAFGNALAMSGLKVFFGGTEQDLENFLAQDNSFTSELKLRSDVVFATFLKKSSAKNF